MAYFGWLNLFAALRLSTTTHRGPLPLVWSSSQSLFGFIYFFHPKIYKIWLFLIFSCQASPPPPKFLFFSFEKQVHKLWQKKWSQGKENGRAWNLLTDYRAWKVWVIRWFLHLDLANTAPGSPWKSTRRECLRASLSLFLNLYKIQHLDTCNSRQRFCKVKGWHFTSLCVCWSSQGKSLANSKWHSVPEVSVKP